jgi:hypothetical protein
MSSHLFDHVVKVDDQPAEHLRLCKVLFHVRLGLADDSDSEAGAGERVTVDKVCGKLQVAPELTNLKRSAVLTLN